MMLWIVGVIVATTAALLVLIGIALWKTGGAEPQHTLEDPTHVY